MPMIGLPVADRPECVAVLDAAFTLARKAGADVTGYHVRPLANEMTDIDLAHIWSGAATPNPGWYLDENSVKEDAARAEKLFNGVAESHGYALGERTDDSPTRLAYYLETTGNPERVFARCGLANDLLVVSRPARASSTKGQLILMSALMDSSTPVLLLSGKGGAPAARRLAIAWNGGRAEGMLVHATLGLLRGAEDVVFITAGEESKPGPTAAEMRRYLLSQGIKAREQTVKGGKTGDLLIETAREEGAEILLAGAYTRGRMRELVFGGVTEYLLSESDFPVLLLHV